MNRSAFSSRRALLALGALGAVSGCALRPGGAGSSGAGAEDLYMVYDSGAAKDRFASLRSLGALSQPWFTSLFERSAASLIRHNGLRGAAYGALPSGRPAGFVATLRPKSVVVFQSSPINVALDVELRGPRGEQLGIWEEGWSVRCSDCSPKDRDAYFQRRIAATVLVVLRVLQDSGAVRLRFSPPRTLDGLTNTLADETR
jgi:hypothetical protein